MSEISRHLVASVAEQVVFLFVWFVLPVRNPNAGFHDAAKIDKQRRIKPPHHTTNKMVCAPSEDSYQPGHLPSLIRVFAVRMKKAWVLTYPFSAQWRLIRLGGCPGWSESSLGAQSFCWFCHECVFLSDPLDEQYKQKMTKKHANARRRVDASKGEMLNKTRKLLVDFYRPHNKKMFRIMGDAAFLYNQPSWLIKPLCGLFHE